MGREVIFIEKECVGRGDARCHIAGRTDFMQWSEGVEFAREYYKEQDFTAVRQWTRTVTAEARALICRCCLQGCWDRYNSSVWQPNGSPLSDAVATAGKEQREFRANTDTKTVLVNHPDHLSSCDGAGKAGHQPMSGRKSVRNDPEAFALAPVAGLSSSAITSLNKVTSSGLHK